jgi:hypothetical protein
MASFFIFDPIEIAPPFGLCTPRVGFRGGGLECFRCGADSSPWTPTLSDRGV